MTRRSLVMNLNRLGNRAVSLLYGTHIRPFRTSVYNALSQPKSGFKPERVAVVTKTTRYEFEQQRYRYAGLSEEDLKQLVKCLADMQPPSQKKRYRPNCVFSMFNLQLAMKGSSYSGLLERHNIHTNNVEHIVKSLR